MSDEQIVYLNGQYMPIGQASISVLDRGFIFGDGIYEVVPVYHGKPFRWANHLARLERSLKRISIDTGMNNDSWTAIVHGLIERHPWQDQFVYMQITRGVARRDHPFPEQVTPTIFAMSSEFRKPAQELMRDGVPVVSLPDERWLNCDIKSISLLGNVLARQSAVDAQATECLMYRDGFLTEGSASNVWVVQDGKVLAPHKDRRILEGIRIGLIEELCASESVPLSQRNVTREEVEAADELLLSSATKEIVAATRLDGKPVGTGKPGPVFAKLHAAYQRAKQAAQDA